MHIVFHSFYKKYNVNNLLFKEAHSEIGDDLLSPFLSIAQYASEENIVVSTSENIDLSSVDAIVFVELPKSNDLFYQQAISSGKRLYLITLESPIIMPDNYRRSNHDVFKKVFTWSDELLTVDHYKYIKINYSFNIPKTLPLLDRANKKLLTLISGNKNSRFPGELYSERENLIKYMESSHPQDFDFYGIDWDYFVFGQTLFERVLNKLRIPRKWLGMQYKSYRGRVSRKNEVLKKYAFSICYENVRGISGYITEKIFDCFFAGCVPIYLGAENVTDYIPENCFIDVRKFESFNSVYQYIKYMPEDEYDNYINCIQSFLCSSNAGNFSNETYSKTIISGILNDLQHTKHE